jgi:hypothetical protein
MVSMKEAVVIYLLLFISFFGELCLYIKTNSLIIWQP